MRQIHQAAIAGRSGASKAQIANGTMTASTTGVRVDANKATLSNRACAGQQRRDRGEQ
jgi:hypothetical protein